MNESSCVDVVLQYNNERYYNRAFRSNVLFCENCDIITVDQKMEALFVIPNKATKSLFYRMLASLQRVIIVIY